MADIWKRTFIQVLTKDIVVERWGTEIYWVVQEPIYRDFPDRYSLRGMTHDPGANTVFAIPDFKRQQDEYRLFPTRTESSTVEDLFEAFRTNLRVPPKQVFVERLRRKVEDQVGAKIWLALDCQ